MTNVFMKKEFLYLTIKVYPLKRKNLKRFEQNESAIKKICFRNWKRSPHKTSFSPLPALFHKKAIGLTKNLDKLKTKWMKIFNTFNNPLFYLRNSYCNSALCISIEEYHEYGLMYNMNSQKVHRDYFNVFKREFIMFQITF